MTVPVLPAPVAIPSSALRCFLRSDRRYPKKMLLRGAGAVLRSFTL